MEECSAAREKSNDPNKAAEGVGTLLHKGEDSRGGKKWRGGRKAIWGVKITKNSKGGWGMEHKHALEEEMEGGFTRLNLSLRKAPQTRQEGKEESKHAKNKEKGKNQSTNTEKRSRSQRWCWL